MMVNVILNVFKFSQDGDAFGDIETHKGVKSEPMSKKSKKI